MAEAGIERNVAADCGEIARDPQAPALERADALREWMQRDSAAASAFIAEQLARRDLADDWRGALVFAAEDARFPALPLQRRVCRELKRIALEFRTRCESGAEQVVWSAVRRFGSLVEADSIHELREFLEPAGYVDARLVALQAVVRAFERRPADDVDGLKPLAGRASDIAGKLFDPDVFCAGEISAVATSAVLVLAVLGDRRALACVHRAHALRRSWVLRKLYDQLQELREGWLAGDSGVTRHPAFALVDEILAEIASFVS